MIKKFQLHKIPFILFILIFGDLVYSQSSDDIVDNVPRDRLVTDAELIDLLDDDFLDSRKLDGKSDLTNLSEYYKERKSPNYFFSKSSMKKDLKEFVKKFSEEVIDINKKVNDYDKTYGINIDWLLPSMDNHGRSLTPNSIRYVARFPLAYEYSISSIINNDDKYKRLLLEQLNDFIDDYIDGEVESKENDVFERFYAGHRTRNLLFAHNILLAGNRLSAAEHIYFIKVFLLHGAKLIDTCEKFHWGNHQLHGLAGLYEMSLMYPEFPVMRKWNELALKTIMQHIETEIMSDGFQFERASHYYKLDIMNYFRIYKISQINNVELPKSYMNRFNKMFDAFVNLSLPSKKLPVLQDAQDKYKVQKGILENNDAAELNDPKETLYMTLGSMVFKNPVYKYFGEETIPFDLYWYFNESERINYSIYEAKTPEIGSVGLEESKYYVMRTGWDKDSYYLLIDGGLAKHKPDHTHGGILGMFANVNGYDVLPTYRVRYSEPTYRYLKNSYVKNVALANNILQGKNWKSNNARTGFGHWQTLPKPIVKDWIAGKYFDYFAGSHNSYDDDSIKYARSVIFFKPNFWLVLDEFKSDKENSYQQLWQGKYNVLNSCNGIVKNSGEKDFYIIQSDYEDMNLNSYSKYGYDSFKFEKKGHDNYTFSTILFPSKNNENGEPTIREYERNDYKQIVVMSDNIKSCYYLNKEKILKLDEIETDAQFVLTSYEDNHLKSFLVYNGSYCNIEDASIKLESKSTFEAFYNDENILEYKKIN